MDWILKTQKRGGVKQVVFVTKLDAIEEANYIGYRPNKKTNFPQRQCEIGTTPNKDQDMKALTMTTLLEACSLCRIYNARRVITS